MNVLLLNAGSSSLKCSLMDGADATVVARGDSDWVGQSTRYQYSGPHSARGPVEGQTQGYAAAVGRFVDDLMTSEPRVLSNASGLAAIGHRIVHGGSFTSAVRITSDVRSRINDLATLAPLHNLPSLEALAAAEDRFPGVPQIAVFDTAFHATLPPEASTYPIPYSWTRDWGIRRYGFHGMSHSFCARAAAKMLHRPLRELRLVICHLGHGCSAAAVHAGKCVDTTMGFTPLEGLMMGTRCGSIDPSIPLHVQQQRGLTPERVSAALHRESGLLGVSGISADMREVLAASYSGNDRARLAIAMYTRRVRQAIGALAVAMGGVDALVFTAGVGEHSPEIRRLVCEGLQCLGLELEATANERAKPDADVSKQSSRGRILVIATREDLTMLEEVRRVLESESCQQGTHP